MVKKEAENILKYKILTIEIQHMWNATNKSDTSNNNSDWNHLKSFLHYLSNTPGKHEIKELQKTAILCAAHTLRKVLMYSTVHNSEHGI